MGSTRRTLAGVGVLAVLLSGCGGGTDDRRDAWVDPSAALVSEDGVAHVYRSATCECCHGHIDHLVAEGFQVTDHAVDDVRSVKGRLGVLAEHESCHTTVIDGYVVEGHVPADEIDRLLAQRPDVDGIALPGMPAGSPGMSGVQDAPFDVRLFADGSDLGPAR